MQKFVTVRIGNEYFGFSIKYIKSIEKMVEPISVPTSFNWLLGLINLRDKVLPVIDLKQILFNQKTDLNVLTRLLFVQTNGSFFGLIVDEALDIFEFLEQDLKGVDIEFGEINFLEGVAKKEDQLISILNLKKLFESLNQVVLDKLQEQMKNDARI